MRIYLSGLDTAVAEVYQIASRINASMLISYAFNARVAPGILRVQWSPFKVFVDSGGFSVRTRGLEVPIEGYRDFLLIMKDYYDDCANLDTSDWDESLRNQRFLERAGLKPLPVYHMTEYRHPGRRDVIRDWAKEYDHVAVSVSAASGKAAGENKKYLDHIFAATGTHVKVHGFGVTQQPLLFEYPFYSVDSTTWLASSQYGAFFEFKRGRVIRYDKPGSGGAKDPLSIGVMLPRVKRIGKSVQAFVELENYLCEWWKRRGVEWQRNGSRGGTSDCSPRNSRRPRGTTSGTTRRRRRSSSKVSSERE